MLFFLPFFPVLSAYFASSPPSTQHTPIQQHFGIIAERKKEQILTQQISRFFLKFFIVFNLV